MRLHGSRIGFYVAIGVCNIMTWGMFNVLSMPRINVAAVADVSFIVPASRQNFTATVARPVRLAVPSLGVDVQVREGVFNPDTQEWSLSDDAAYYAVGSTLVNDSNGTTLIYGHARPAMFEPLLNTMPGTTLDVYTDNGKVFSYAFSSMREVVPTDTSVFTDTGPPTVVLQTCTGPWDQYRALYSFSFVGMRDQ